VPQIAFGTDCQCSVGAALTTKDYFEPQRHEVHKEIEIAVVIGGFVDEYPHLLLMSDFLAAGSNLTHVLKGG
jgi:hypothetical protein